MIVKHFSSEIFWGMGTPIVIQITIEINILLFFDYFQKKSEQVIYTGAS